MSKTSLRDRLEKAIQGFPKNILLEDDHSSWTGERLAPYLQFLVQRISRETLPGGRVGIGFWNGAPQAIAVLATLLAGRVPVMINSVDLMAGLFDWIKLSKLNFLILAEELASHASIPHLILNREGLSLSLTGKTNVEAQLDELLYHPPEGTALVLFTSGSTGEPKEIYVPEKGLLKVIDALIEKFRLNEKSIASIALPVCHSMAMNTQFLPTLLAGGKCRFHNLRLSINRIFRETCKEQATFVSLIGEVIRSCWDERRIKNLSPCETVKHVQLAGGMITPRHISMAKELFPQAQIHKGYGLTEAIRVTMIDSEDPQFGGTAVGRPLDFIEIQIRGDDQRVLPPGQTGEIYVRGDSLMLGSRPLRGQNVRLLEPQAFLPTGDMGTLDDQGYLHVSGRLDSLFKINGRRVSGVEIEKVVLDVFDQFRLAKAILVSDNEKDRPQIILFIELDRNLWSGRQPSVAPEVLNALVERLKSVSVPPKKIIFTPLIPRTSNGKLNLPQLYEIWKERSVRLREGESLKNLRLMSMMEGG